MEHFPRVEHFPIFVDRVLNEELNLEVIKKELNVVVFSFHKDQSPGSNWWSIDFFRELYD